ncbi:histidyl-tRNA synthetase, partial [Bacillus sp. SG-1]
MYILQGIESFFCWILSKNSEDTTLFIREGDSFMSIKIPRGTQDILPADSVKWQYVEKTAADICRNYQYEEIRTPIFESSELFLRGVGDTTDIVQ